MKWDRPIKLAVDKALGYVYFMDRQHPLGDKKGRVWYHRHVASMARGWWVTPQEIVHHVDDDRQNNDPSNLEVTTQSEHARAHAVEKGGTARLPIPCAVCKEMFTPTKHHMRFCSLACSHQGRRVFDPSKEQLERLVWEMPTRQVAEIFGVSDNAVGKRCKKLGIKKPGRGYWAKKRAKQAPMA
jgi:hypothetical protein